MANFLEYKSRYFILRSKFIFQKSDIYVNFLEWGFEFRGGKKGEGAPGLSGAPSRGVVEMFSIRAEDQQQREPCRQRCFRIS